MHATLGLGMGKMIMHTTLVWGLGGDNAHYIGSGDGGSD